MPALAAAALSLAMLPAAASAGSPNSSFPYPLVKIGDRLFMAADDGVHGQELWISDGTKGGTVLLKDTFDGPSDGGASNFFPLKGSLLFVAEDSDHGRELWISDGTEDGTTLLKDINPDGDSNPFWFVRLGDHVYFAGFTDDHGAELWQTDGTEEGTELVVDKVAGPDGLLPSHLTPRGQAGCLDVRRAR